jgi:hypothetical protein
LLKTTNLDEVLALFCDISTFNDFQIINLSSGKKITVSLSDQFLEQDVLPGDLLKLYNV